MLETILIAVVSISIVLGAMIWLVGERGKLFMPSTLEFIQKGGLVRFLNLSTLHGYIYMRWQKSYLGILINQIGPRSSQAARKWWSDQYHSKVLTERQVRTVDQKVVGSRPTGHPERLPQREAFFRDGNNFECMTPLTLLPLEDV